MDICQHSRGMIRPGFASIITFETKKAQGAPDAQSHPRLACKRKRHRYAETPALPAQWLTAYTWFPRCPGLLATVPPGSRRVGPKADIAIPGVDPSVGASGQHDFAARIRLARPAAPTRPSHPRLASGDDWPNAPLA